MSPRPRMFYASHSKHLAERNHSHKATSTFMAIICTVVYACVTNMHAYTYEQIGVYRHDNKSEDDA